jgi:hypothetical protein
MLAGLSLVCSFVVVVVYHSISHQKEMSNAEVQSEETMEVIVDGEVDVEVQDELEMEYEKIQDLDQQENAITGYQNILQHERTDDAAMKIKEKAIYG